MKVHIKENRAQFRRFTSKWTPTIMIVDDSGKEFFRAEGYLPPHDFLTQLMIGLGRTLFLRNRPKEAHRLFREVADRFTDTDFAPEAEYWSAVAQYRATADHKCLDEIAGILAKKYPTSNWTKRASVWGH